MSLADIVLDLLAKATSQAPMPHPTLAQAVLSQRPETTPDEIPDVLDQLVDQRLVATCRVTRGGITRDVYWRTALRRTAQTLVPAPTRAKAQPQPTKETIMKETAGDRLAKLIAQHGPIIGADLADKSGLPAKSLDAYMRTQLLDGRIESRMGYSRERGRELKHYMTPEQAQAWDEADASLEAAMASDAKQTGAEIPVNETGPDDREAKIAAQASTIHALRNDVAAANLVLNHMALALSVESHVDIPRALDQLLHRLGNPPASQPSSLGRLALLLIDSTELTSLDELGTDDVTIAHGRAVTAIQDGQARRAIVVRILGEAQRIVEWRDAA